MSELHDQLTYTREALEDERKARQTAGECADRFRDVLCEVLGFDDENPGDDELVRRIRGLHGKTGPEPRRWRNFLTGAISHLECSGFQWRTDVVLSERLIEPEPQA